MQRLKPIDAKAQEFLERLMKKAAKSAHATAEAKNAEAKLLGKVVPVIPTEAERVAHELINNAALDRQGRANTPSVNSVGGSNSSGGSASATPTPTPEPDKTQFKF